MLYFQTFICMSEKFCTFAHSEVQPLNNISNPKIIKNYGVHDFFTYRTCSVSACGS